jgi:hypothetical protein
MECILVLPNEEDKASRGNPPAKFHDRSEILRLSDPLLFWKPEGSFHGGPARHLSAEWISVPSSGIEAPRPQAGASRKRNFKFIVPLHPARSAGLVGHLPVRIQTVNLFLPFIRLRFRTFRPLRVLILSKNP